MAPPFFASCDIAAQPLKPSGKEWVTLCGEGTPAGLQAATKYLSPSSIRPITILRNSKTFQLIGINNFVANKNNVPKINLLPKKAGAKIAGNPRTRSSFPTQLRA
jgi:hypothetical protein